MTSPSRAQRSFAGRLAGRGCCGDGRLRRECRSLLLLDGRPLSRPSIENVVLFGSFSCIFCDSSDEILRFFSIDFFRQKSPDFRPRAQVSRLAAASRELRGPEGEGFESERRVRTACLSLRSIFPFPLGRGFPTSNSESRGRRTSAYEGSENIFPKS